MMNALSITVQIPASELAAAVLLGEAGILNEGSDLESGTHGSLRGCNGLGLNNLSGNARVFPAGNEVERTVAPSGKQSTLYSMFKNHFLIFTAAGAVSIAGCGRETSVVVVPRSSIEEPVAVDPDPKTRTRETHKLGQAIDQYAAHPSAEGGAEVRKRFASLDGEVAELELFVAKSKGAEREEATAKLHNLQSYRASEAIRFTNLTGPSSLPASSETQVPARTGVEKVEQKARDIGDTLEAGAKKAGETIKEAAERTKEAVKETVQ
jgi:hypothetical protein